MKNMRYVLYAGIALLMGSNIGSFVYADCFNKPVTGTSMSGCTNQTTSTQSRVYTPAAPVTCQGTTCLNCACDPNTAAQTYMWTLWNAAPCTGGVAGGPYGPVNHGVIDAAVTDTCF